jgi:hypothetical protein
MPQAWVRVDGLQSTFTFIVSQAEIVMGCVTEGRRMQLAGRSLSHACSRTDFFLGLIFREGEKWGEVNDL